MKLWIVVYRFNPANNWKLFADSCFDNRDLACKYVDVKRYNDPGIMLAILECTATEVTA
jgi:hypothetical protein